MLLCLVVLAVGLLAPAAPASAARADFEDAAAAAARHDDLLALKRQPALSHHHESICESLDWRKKALKLVAEIPAAGATTNRCAALRPAPRARQRGARRPLSQP